MAAATLYVYSDIGGTANTPASSSRIDNLGPPALRFKTADDRTIDTANPILVSSTVTRYSYWKHIYLYVGINASANDIDNIRFYSDGAIGFGTGVTLNVADETPTKNSGSSAGYDPAAGSEGITGNVVTTHTDVTAVTDAASLTSGSPLTVSVSEDGGTTDPMTTVGDTSDYVILQVAVATTASAGLTASETLTFQYDETP